jgi:hypothetical protein
MVNARRVMLAALCLTAALVPAVAADAAAPAHGKITLRTGKVTDRDTIAGDGKYSIASGIAKCRPGERVLSGWGALRSTAGLFGGAAKVSEVVSQKLPKQNGWKVVWNSDLGGDGGSLLEVVVECES